MPNRDEHPEQDPAEGARDVIDHELSRRAGKDKAADRSKGQAAGDHRKPEPRDREHRPM